MDEQRCFVQFMHPGAEHRPDEPGLKLWNEGPHRRKFIQQRGQYIDRKDRGRAGEIVFWAEWEPPSFVIRRFADPRSGLPEFLHQPFVPETAPAERQNTDPFVFGDCFYYTGCQQHMKRRETQMRRLKPGSVILFGSNLDSRFVLDTVFVVRDFIDHSRRNWQRVLGGHVSAIYRRVTLEPWYGVACGESGDESYRLYFGATPKRPFEGMFSFFPCAPAVRKRHGFSRPAVRIPGRINPVQKQGRKIVKGCEIDVLQHFWNDVVSQVRNQGLELGVYAELPSHRRMP